MPLHVHLDPVGGVAGDMFVAAILDARPEFAEGLHASLRTLDFGDSVGFGAVDHRDHVLCGKRFLVRDLGGARGHSHTPYADIVRRVSAAGLSAAVRERALALLATLADAEAAVHGIARDDVELHEAGSVDSIVDMVSAAWLIEALGPATWSVGPLPLGSGRVKSAHGLLPVPVPAVVALTKGFETLDDGIPGERVTPTGAAILRHLDCERAQRPRRSRLQASGNGFGTRTMSGISNCLRALFLEVEGSSIGRGEVSRISFEVDDQSPEDLAIGLDRLRAMPEVIDVVQMAAFGKKGRMCVHVQVLARRTATDEVVERCFEETTTIGLRCETVARYELERSHQRVRVADTAVALKAVQRPESGTTVKVEADDLAAVAGHAARTRLRSVAQDRVADPEDER